MRSMTAKPLQRAGCMVGQATLPAEPKRDHADYLSWELDHEPDRNLGLPVVADANVLFGMLSNSRRATC